MFRNKSRHPHNKRSKKRISYLILGFGFIIACSIVAVAYLFKPEEASARWFDDAWLYRLPITVSNSSGGALSDFQVKVTVDSDTLYTAGKVQADCDDLRFTDATGNLLPFWIEDTASASEAITCNSADIDVWIRVPSIPTSGAYLYMYYGNASAASVSNGFTTFPFFDDFATLNTATWTATGSASVSNGEVSISTGAIYRNASLTYLPANYYFEQRVKWTDTTGNNSGLSVAEGQSINVNNIDSQMVSSLVVSSTGTYDVGAHAGDGGAASYNVVNGTIQYTTSASTYHVSGMAFDSSTVKYYNARSLTNSYTETISAFPYIFLGFLRGSGSGTVDGRNMTTDWVLSRKYASTMPSASNGTEEKSPGPALYWKLDEGIGTTAYESIQGNNGTLTNSPAWRDQSECISSRCLLFDGTNDYVQVANDFYSDAMTICVWIKPTSFDSSTNNIVLKRNNSSNAAATNEFNLTMNTSGQINWSSWTGGSLTINMTTTQGVPLNTWSHICAVQGGASTASAVYINGKVAATGTQGTAMTDGASVIQLGSLSAGTSDRYFNGYMDEVKIYQYARTAAQVKQDATVPNSEAGGDASFGNGPAQSLTDGLRAYYPVNERAANSCTGGANDSCDYSGSANDMAWDANDPTASTTSKFGWGLDFESSTSDFASIADNSSLSITGDLTLSAWINIETVANSGIIAKDVGSSPNRGYYLSIQSSKLRFLISDDGSNVIYRDGNTTLTTGVWYHVLATYNSRAGTMDIYLNGVLDNGALTGTVPSSMVDSTSTTRLGYSPSNGYFDGVIDEARIYNRAFTVPDVKALYNYAPGPIAYWKFDENTGSSVSDSSNNANNLTNNGSSTWDPGKYGSATGLTGSTGWFLADNSAFDNLGAITIETWVNRKSAVSFQRLLGKYYFTAGSFGSWLVRFTDTNKIAFDITSDGTTFSSIETTNTLSNDTWYHVAAVYDGATMRLYLNGVLEGSGSKTGVIPDSAYCVTIGYTATSTAGCVTSAQNYLTGSLDEIKFYDYARTPAQIAEDMGNSPSARALVPSIQYSFEEGNGTTTQDLSLNNYDGTLTNMASPATTTSGWAQFGRVGRGLNFDATNDYVNIPDNILLDATSFTASVWVYPRTFAVGDKIFVRDDGVTSRFWQLQIATTGGQVQFLGKAPNTWDYTINSSINLTSSQWNHVVITVDSVTDMAYLYINGVLAGSDAGAGDMVTGTRALEMGGAAVAATSSLDGYIDEFKYYNYALTPADVLIDYNQNKAASFGSASTTSAGTVSDNSMSRAYCVPGDTSTCNVPVGEWKLDENTSTTAADSSGNSNTGTLTGGPTWSPGKEGLGVNFDGNDDYITVPDASSLDLTTALTISAWVNIDDDTSEMDYVSKWMTGGLGAYFLGHDGSGNIVLGLSSDGTTYADYKAVYDFTPGVWYFVTASWNTTNDLAVIYVNGVPLTTTLTTGTSPASLFNSSTTVNIGARYTGSYANFDGTIDTVKIYNYVRTPAQVAWEYNNNEANLADLRFDECQNSTLNDRTGLGNNGAITIGASGGNTALGTCQGSSGQAWKDGAVGYSDASLEFDGTDDYVVINSSSSLNNGSGSRSMTLWVKAAAVTDSFLAMKYSSATPSGSGDYWLGIVSSKWVARSNGGTGSVSSIANAATNTWTHLTLVWTSGGNLKLYVNGVLQGTDASSGTITNASQPIWVGRWNTTYFSGQLDELKIYGYALTDAQVRAIYNNGAVNFK